MVAYCSGYRDYDIVILVHWSTVHWQCYCYIVLWAVLMCYKQCGLVDHNVVDNVKHTSDFVVFSLFHKKATAS